jgi:hypothetical protein
MSEQLIYALSSLGQVTLDHYNELFKHLYLPACGIIENDETVINHRRQVGRILDSLGYLEFDYNARKVFMCPPALVMLPSQGLPKALLTGARTPAMLKKLKKEARKNKKMVMLHRHRQSMKWISLPDVFWIDAASIDSLRDIANQSEIMFSPGSPAGWQMANLSISIDNIENELTFTARGDINWKKRVFNAERLRFSYARGGADSCQLAEYTHPLTQQKMHWLWDGAKASEISRDWGRYLVLRKSGKSVILYDEAGKLLGIPLTVPLPKILSRAAALCSGKAPSICMVNREKIMMPDSTLLNLYEEVPEVIAQMIAKKTGQKLILTNMDFKDKRGDHD